MTIDVYSRGEDGMMTGKKMPGCVPPRQSKAGPQDRIMKNSDLNFLKTELPTLSKLGWQEKLKTQNNLIDQGRLAFESGFGADSCPYERPECWQTGLVYTFNWSYWMDGFTEKAYDDGLDSKEGDKNPYTHCEYLSERWEYGHFNRAELDDDDAAVKSEEEPREETRPIHSDANQLSLNL